MKNKILTIIGLIIFIVIMFVALNHGLRQMEINECVKWQKQSERFENFYWTDWQKMQCSEVMN